MPKRTKYRQIISRSLLLLGATSAITLSFIASANRISFATIDYCPFTCIAAKENGKEGFMIDVLRYAFENVGYTLDITVLPYARAVASVKNGMYDGIAVVGKGYAPELVYPNQPTVRQKIAFLVSSDSLWRYDGVQSLADKTVGIVKGFYYVDADLVAYLNQEQNNPERVVLIHGDNTTIRGLNMLLTHHVTTFLEGEYSATYELEKFDNKSMIRVAGYTNESFDDYTGFSPSNPNSIKYAQILSDALDSMKESGKLDYFLKSYGIVPEHGN